MKFKYKHPKLAIALKIFLVLFILLFVVATGIIGGLIYGGLGDDLNIDISELTLQENSIIVDSEGNTIAELSGDENRKIITLEEMSPYLPKAYIAIEDERFKTHHGIDIKRTGAAVLSFVTHAGKSTAGGGSTITQQLVKNITQEKASSGIDGITRKLKEWIRAYQIEDVMSKDQILELYLNLIFIGGKGKENGNGVEIGAEYYFNKTAKDLSIAQCAFLAGINHSPNKYNPYGENDVTERITKRTKTVLGQMKKLEYITQEEYDAAVAEVEAGFKFEKGVKGNIYSAHTDALISQLIEQIMEEKQISQNAAETYLYSSGLKIYSTQVTSIQNVMENEANNKKYYLELKEKGQVIRNEDGSPILAQGAATVIDPKTGYVLGCIGQLREKTTSRGLNRAKSERQTGSSFKPLADLLPGLEEGIITPATVYMDSRTIFANGYPPENYNGFKGKRNVRNSITTSQNIPFVKVMAELTPAKSMEYLKKMGITSLDEERDKNLPLAIGGLTYGVSTLEMAGAYASISNDGIYIEPTFYTKVEDSDGKVVLEPKQKTEKVCSPETAYIVKDIMKTVVTGTQGHAGTATYCGIRGMDVAAKTGTSNESKDRWLCGFTNYYACAAWYGFDDPKRVSFPGTNPAGQLFDGIMTAIHKGLPNSTFTRPDGVVTAKVCTDSGMLASDKCTNTYSEIFIKGHLPKTCDAHTDQYTICKQSGKLPNEFCPADQLETKSTGYIYEKERLGASGLWNTPEAKVTITKAPTEYCTIHKKPEEVKPPVEPDDDKKTETGDPNKKPDTGTPDTGKPDTGTPDTGKPDTGTPDTGKPDTGTPDTGKPDDGKPATPPSTSDGGSTGGSSGNNGQSKPQT